MFGIPLWIVLAFAAPVLMAFNTVVDKIILNKFLNDGTIYLILILFTNIFFLVPAPLFVNIRMEPVWVLASVVTGVIFGLSFYFYMQVMEVEEASSVAVLTRLMPVFAIPLAVLFLGEILTAEKYLGILLLSLGGLVVSANGIDLRRLKLGKGIVIISIFNFLIAGTSVAQKFILNHNDFWPLFYWLNVGGLAAGILLFVTGRRRKRFVREMRTADPTLFILRGLSVVTYVMFSIFTVIALKEGVATIVISITSIMPLVVFVYSLILTLVVPGVLREDLSRVVLRQKLLSLVLVIVGSWLAV